MKITEIKTAINNRIIEKGGKVYSNETDEGYDKPAFFAIFLPRFFPNAILREQQVSLQLFLLCWNCLEE